MSAWFLLNPKEKSLSRIHTRASRIHIEGLNQVAWLGTLISHPPNWLICAKYLTLGVLSFRSSAIKLFTISVLFVFYRELLMSFHRSTGQKPQRIIFYRYLLSSIISVFWCTYTVFIILMAWWWAQPAGMVLVRGNSIIFFYLNLMQFTRWYFFHEEHNIWPFVLLHLLFFSAVFSVNYVFKLIVFL